MVRNNVFRGGKCVKDVVAGEEPGVGDVIESVMMILGAEAGEDKRFLYQSWWLMLISHLVKS